jgi:GTPase-activator protein for Ras-like GTPase
VFAAWDGSTPPDEQPLLVDAVMRFALSTGTVFSVIRGLVRHEFTVGTGKVSVAERVVRARSATAAQKASASRDTGPAGVGAGSIMRGNSIASRFAKLYLSRIGLDYLHTILDDVLKHVAALDHVVELDPMKLSPPPTDMANPENDPTVAPRIAANKEEMIELVRLVVEAVTRSVGQMPDEIKFVASIFADLADRFAPQQFFSLIGGFLILRYINPALLSPDSFGLATLKDGTVIEFSPMARRNLVLMAKILQNISNGQEFGKKEPYMMVFNELVRANVWKIEKYFREVVTTAPTESPEQIALDVLTDASVTRVHSLLAYNSEVTLLRESQAETLQKISNLLGQLKRCSFVFRRFSVLLFFSRLQF